MGSSSVEGFHVYSDEYVQLHDIFSSVSALHPGRRSLAARPNGRRVLLQLDPVSSSLPQLLPL